MKKEIGLEPLLLEIGLKPLLLEKRPTNLRHDQKPIRQKMEIRLVFLTSKNEYSLHKGLNLIHGASKSYSFVYRA